MTMRCRITVNGETFDAQRGELLLDAALRNGLDLPYDCRSGHCGTCCVQLVSGVFQGGEATEPGVVHACQCRIAGDAVVEKRLEPVARAVNGTLRILRPLSRDVMEAGIVTERALPYLPGQYVQVGFAGFPSRPFSITHALRGPCDGGTMFFHIRRMGGGRVTPELGRRIKTGHRVTLSGPFGAAHFRPGCEGRLVLAGTNTGFAPIWSIAVAALREDPARSMMVIAGGRTLDALYMGPALAQLARFPNLAVVPVCSSSQDLPRGVLPGRPTDYLPVLKSSDVLYACGAAGMVDSVRQVAARHGAICYADPFKTTAMNLPVQASIAARAMAWLSVRQRRIEPVPDLQHGTARMALARPADPSLSRFGSRNA